MEFLKTVLPWIGAAATGGVPAIVGMAAKTVGEVIGGDVGSTAKDIAAAVAGATPDQMLALKKADNDFAVRMQELGFKQAVDLETIYANDRANARAREIATHDKFPAILATVVTFGFFFILWYLIKFGVPQNGVGEALLVMLGSLGTAWTGVVQYYFGSSAGSARKDSTIAVLNKGGANA